METKTKEIGAMSDQELVTVIADSSNSENPDNSDETATGESAVVVEKSTESESENADQTATVPASAPTAPTRAEFDTLMSNLNAMKSEADGIRRDNENLRKLNGHLSNELGVLRKPPVLLPTDTEMLSEPVPSTKRVVEAVLEEKDQVNRAQIELATRQSREVDSTIRGLFPDFEEQIEGMIQILKEHKAHPEFIAAFKKDPAAAIPDAGHLLQLVARAKERKLAVAKDSEIADLKKQLEAAKKGNTRMASSIKDAAAAGPSITSTTVKTGKSRTEVAPNFSTMKTEDIKKWLTGHKDVSD